MASDQQWRIVVDTNEHITGEVKKMALRNIRRKGDPVLREKASRVRRITSKLYPLLDDMVETMIEAQGVGLAAPQVGISKNIIVVRNKENIMEFINPEIIDSEGEITDIEGCLSIPGIYGEVPRSAKVRVEGLDREGKLIKIEAEGFFARILQHEIDHLHGILFIDRAIRLLTPEEIEKNQVK
ncbi:MAG: peptide deformylase [Dethiobacteria bacterium]